MTDHEVGLALVDIALVIAVARVIATILARVGQPPVIAEILGGIALGPTLLGALPGDPSSALFPDDVRGALAAIGTVGLIIFVFLVGLELDLRALRRYDRIVAAISSGAVVLPFALGIGAAALLYGGHDIVGGERVGFLPFALFVGTALSITAFPVLTRIIVDRGLERTALGQLATGSAAIQDLCGWMLLAVSLAALSGDGALPFLQLVGKSLVFVAIVALVVRPLLRRYVQRQAASSGAGADTIAVTLALLTACAGATQLIGLHSVLGAFALALAFPRAEFPELVAQLRRTLAPVTLGVLLPVFFVGPGLETDFGTVAQGGAWEFALIMVCACGGKIIGVVLPARGAGLGLRDSTALGILLNTRGLMELIVLNVGLTAGVLDQSLFSAMVLMTLATTMMTGPLLQYLSRRSTGTLWREHLHEPAHRHEALG